MEGGNRGRSKRQQRYVEESSSDDEPEASPSNAAAFAQHGTVSTYPRPQSFHNPKFLIQPADLAPKDHFPASMAHMAANESVAYDDYPQWQNQSSRPREGLRVYNNMPAPWSIPPHAASPAYTQYPFHFTGGHFTNQYPPGYLAAQAPGTWTPAAHPAAFYQAQHHQAQFIPVPQGQPGNVHPTVSQPRAPPRPRHDL